LFPEGEAFFVRSVAAFAKDPRVESNENLKKDVKSFISQEVQHSAEHHSYNKEIGIRFNHDMNAISR
jgi:predicted metal-dependent hydrolase